MKSKGNRLTEWAKSAMIVFLTLSAVLLGSRSGLFNTIPLFAGVSGLSRSTATGQGDAGGTSFKEAARPLVILVTNSHGDRYGVKYDTVARNAVYDRTSSILGEALGSALDPEEISEEEWREVLLGRPSVFYEYAVPVRLSTLEAWLGARLPGNIPETFVRRLFVAFGDERSSVYYQNSENGLFYFSETASSAAKAQELDIYADNGAMFAFEKNIDAGGSAPYYLILEVNTHPDIRAAASGDADELLDLVQGTMNYSNESVIPSDRGDALVRVGSQFNLRADPLGRVSFRRTDIMVPSNEERTVGEAGMIEKARGIVADTIGSLSGAGEVFFEYLEYGDGETISLYFSYYAAGGRIHAFEEGYAAKFIYSDGIITEMELCFRSYAYSGEYSKLVPEIQALAAAKAEFMLSYMDTGTERLQPMWVRLNSEFGIRNSELGMNQ